ncbi:hypothetical protein LUZ60_007915 [Juncus effusus]|nr:hypothetical protein LUZ60_007915 [Juncus effusus]
MKRHLPSRPPAATHRRRRRLIIPLSIIFSCAFLCFLLFSRIPSSDSAVKIRSDESETQQENVTKADCATVEQMGDSLASSASEMKKSSLRARQIIKHHFDLHGAERVRELPAMEFCKRGFVLGKSSEAGFGNEMYKILTGAALSIMLNRSLIIGQTRGLYPFGEYISYTNQSFTLGEVKHLWRKNKCLKNYKRALKIRVDNFENPRETNVLCSDWTRWNQPIIWFDGTTDATGIQFFLKNVNPKMRAAAVNLFGNPNSLGSRPNVFGELMNYIISPSELINSAVNWVLKGVNPDISLHMRMLSNRSIRATNAAVKCIKKAIEKYCAQVPRRPRILLVSDTPSFISDIKPYLTEFADVIYFDYKLFERSGLIQSMDAQHQRKDFRAKDWGPAPRWAALVDFFLAVRARQAVVSGAHRRVGTTFVQLIASLATSRHLSEEKDPSNPSNFTFLSSFQSNLLTSGLSSQTGWGHAWNRFAGPLSCHSQPDQCAITPVLPSAWWDATWQRPVGRDVGKMVRYGVRVDETGEVDEGSLKVFCMLSYRSQPDQCALTPVLPSVWWDAIWQCPVGWDVVRMMRYGVRVEEIGEVDESNLRVFCMVKKESVKNLIIIGS